MKNIFFILLIITYLFNAIDARSVSIVYNLRVAQTTRRQRLEEKKHLHSIAAVTAFGQFRKKYDETHQSIGGGLGTYIYTLKSVYAKVDFAAARAHEENTTTTTFSDSRTQTDDLLITAGYSHKINDRKRFTLSGILGLPTHKDTNLEGFSFGTGHIGLGLQADGAFIYSPKKHHAIMAAARYVHFFPRDADVTINDTKQRFDFALGNLIDLLIAHSSHWNKHSLEIGYNPSFAFGAHINPPLDDVVDKTNFIRSSFYGAYQYRFAIRAKPSAIALALSYGLDHINKRFGNKQIVTVWALWGINF